MMATILQQAVPPPVLSVMKKHGVRIKNFTSAAVFERFLLKFLGSPDFVVQVKQTLYR